LFHTHAQKYEAAEAEAAEVIALANEKGSPFWVAFGTATLGAVSALTGKPSDAVQIMTSGLAMLASTGTAMWRPFYLSCLAAAYADLTQFDAAWYTISEAAKAIETTGELWCEAEVHRTAGEITRRSPELDPAKAEAYFKRALAVARQQQAKSLELRAATSMARLWRDQGKRDEARDLLAPVYGWFTESFDTRDLKDAKVLLDELAAR
jgi:predicted ATPase